MHEKLSPEEHGGLVYPMYVKVKLERQLKITGRRGVDNPNKTDWGEKDRENAKIGVNQLGSSSKFFHMSSFAEIMRELRKEPER